jgi:hypothetical protein
MTRVLSARPSVSRPLVANPRIVGPSIASPSIADPVPSGDDAAVYLSPYPGGAVRTGMNWRRGCFRLWVVGSALFVVAVAAVTSYEIKTLFEQADRSTALPVYPWTTLMNGIGIAVGVPFIVLIVGAVLGWAISGFKPSAPRAGF